MRRRYTLPAVAVSAVMTAPAAYALNFDFSFTGAGGGEVTGEIFGLEGSGPSAATDIQVYGAPAFIGLPSTPFDLFPETANKNNTFTVNAGGQLTAASFQGGKSNILLALNAGGNFLANFQGHAYTTSNYSGFAGVTYTPVAASSAPEPASIALLGAGLAGISAFRRRRMAA